MHDLVSVVVGVIVGGMYFQVNTTIGGETALSATGRNSACRLTRRPDRESAGFQSRVGALFFMGCLIAFASLSALSNFARAKRLFVRERARGYYHPSAWLATQLVLDVFPLRIVPTIVLSVIV